MANIFNRRSFMTKSGTLILAAALGDLVFSCASKKNPLSPETHQTIILDLSKPEYGALNTVGEAIKVARAGGEKPVIVRRDSTTQVSAFSSQCTHMGCEVPLPSGNVITCPCHGSKYDQNGNLISGPAPKSLPHYSAVLDGNIITITT